LHVVVHTCHQRLGPMDPHVEKYHLLNMTGFGFGLEFQFHGWQGCQVCQQDSKGTQTPCYHLVDDIPSSCWCWSAVPNR
jgi:hypothetical protein